VTDDNFTGIDIPERKMIVILVEDEQAKADYSAYQTTPQYQAQSETAHPSSVQDPDATLSIQENQPSYESLIQPLTNKSGQQMLQKTIVLVPKSQGRSRVRDPQTLENFFNS